MEEEVTLKEPSEKGPEVGPEAGLEEIDFAPLIDYFGMDRPSLDEKNDLRELWSYLPKGNNGETLTALKRLEIRLGSPPTSENRLRRIISYLSIDRQIDSLVKEQEAYVRS